MTSMCLKQRNTTNTLSQTQRHVVDTETTSTVSRPIDRWPCTSTYLSTCCDDVDALTQSLRQTHSQWSLLLLYLCTQKTHHCETTEALRVFNAALAQVWPYSVWTLWLRPTAGYWTHRHFMSTNATQWWSDETPWGWWWHSQLAEYYGGNSTRHVKQCSVSK